MSKIAVVLHLYHVDLADEFRNYFKKFTVPYDLYISTSKGNTSNVLNVFPQATIVEGENIGMDFYPFTSIFHKEIMQYDLVLKIHSKKSGHNPHLKGWRSHLLNNLLYDTNDIIDMFESDETIGLLYPSTYHAVIRSMEWSINFPDAQSLLSTIGIPIDIITENKLPDYSAGSMFWFRPQALHQLFNGAITANTYKTLGKLTVWVDGHPLDGDASHALERIIGAICKYNKYRIQNYTPLPSCNAAELMARKLYSIVVDDEIVKELFVRRLMEQIKKLDKD